MVYFTGREIMLKKLQTYRIQKRLKVSSLIALLLTSVAAIVALIAMGILIFRYNHTLTYYATLLWQ